MDIVGLSSRLEVKNSTCNGGDYRNSNSSDFEGLDVSNCTENVPPDKLDETQETVTNSTFYAYYYYEVSTSTFQYYEDIGIFQKIFYFKTFDENY